MSTKILNIPLKTFVKIDQQKAIFYRNLAKRGAGMYSKKMHRFKKLF